MKKAISLVLVLAIMVTMLTACSSSTNSNSDITVNTASFSKLKCEEDAFTGITYYYPNITSGNIEKEEYSRDGKTRYAFCLEADTWELTAFPVIRYDPTEDIPYQLECSLQYRCKLWGSYTGLSFNKAVIVTDNHRYNISKIIETSPLGVYNSINIIPLGKTGIEMVKDICSSASVQIRMGEGDEAEDITVENSVFRTVLDVIKLYEDAGCGQYNFSNIDANITVS